MPRVDYRCCALQGITDSLLRSSQARPAQHVVFSHGYCAVLYTKTSAERLPLCTQFVGEPEEGGLWRMAGKKWTVAEKGWGGEDRERADPVKDQT